jgi:hypothetical protein
MVNVMSTNPTLTPTGILKPTKEEVMGMKPRLDDANQKHDIPGVVSCQNHAPGDETSPNIANTATTHKVEMNKKLDPNLATGPKTHGG